MIRLYKTTHADYRKKKEMRKIVAQADPNDIEVKYKVVDFGEDFKYQQTSDNNSPNDKGIPRYPEREIVEYESKQISMMRLIDPVRSDEMVQGLLYDGFDECDEFTI